MGFECCGTPHGRRYLSNAEKMDLLKQYREELENELKGVDERIKAIGKEV